MLNIILETQGRGEFYYQFVSSYWIGPDHVRIVLSLPTGLTDQVAAWDTALPGTVDIVSKSDRLGSGI